MAILTDEQITGLRKATTLPVGSDVNSATLADLQSIVMTNAIKTASEFTATTKVVDGDAAPLASAYRSKMISACNQIINQPVRGGAYVNVIMNVLFSYFGVVDLGFTYAQVNGADTASLQVFLDANMLKIIEVMAGVLPEEKTEYNGL